MEKNNTMAHGNIRIFIINELLRVIKINYKTFPNFIISVTRDNYYDYISEI